jgi:hypothetical protein
MVVGQPLRIVRKFGETSFKPLIFTLLVGVVRDPRQFGIFDCFGAILLGGEHSKPFCERISPLLISVKHVKSASEKNKAGD